MEKNPVRPLAMTPTIPQKIELLAPARDCETGMAAVSCGADAVYIGAEAFGAREAAGNSIEEIERLIRYAHRYYARVYVTLNTLLYDRELAAAERLARRVWEAGGDALIIQDMAFLEMDLPPLPLFASTQTDNRTPEKVRFLEEAGLSRVILARELTLREIAAIRAATTVPLECFVHGALCVCYSGQCTMSYAMGGRSGNRGRCAQPCRKRYDLVDSDGVRLVEGRHLLSLKDMDRSASLPELLDAGVTSFKIEGRLKDLPYVVNVVSHYRQALDRLLDGERYAAASSGRVTFDFEPDPLRTFNRGYTDYGLKGDKRGMASLDTPKSTGEPLGPVSRTGRDFFTLAGGASLAPGDGICFFDDGGRLSGTSVNGVEGEKVFPERMAGILPGRPLFRNLDRRFSKLLSGIPARREIPLEIHLSGGLGGITLRLSDGEGSAVQVALPGPFEGAREPGKGIEALRRQLVRLGGTPFRAGEVDLALDAVPFVPPSALNELRRLAVEALLSEREEKRPRERAERVRNDFPYPFGRLTYLGNVLNEKARAFYRRHGVEEIEPAAESGLDMGGRKVMTTRYCLMEAVGLCGGRVKRKGLKEPLFLVDEEGRRFRLRFDCVTCEMEIFAP